MYHQTEIYFIQVRLCGEPPKESDGRLLEILKLHPIRYQDFGLKVWFKSIFTPM